MAQGQAASALVRAYLATREDAYARSALAAARAMTEHGERFRIVHRLRSGVAYEECPSDPPSLILNGWIFALWGIRDVGRALGRQEFEESFEAGAETLAGYVREFDYGWWSRYSLFPPLAPDLAKPSYHTVHADQLEVMHGLTGNAEFARLAGKWHHVDTRRNRTRAVLAKGRTVLTARLCDTGLS
jgi:uncharacterized protein YyaL (SSP411 family)